MSAALQSSVIRGEDDTIGTESRGSSVALLPGDSARPAGASGLPSDHTSSEATESTDNTTKPRKRDFWKLGKKTDDEKLKHKDKTLSAINAPAPKPSTAYITPISALRPSSPMRHQEATHVSASPRSYPYAMSASPGQGLFSSSPRLHSPASSQIFERDVQEDVVSSQASPQIPSHII